MTDRPDPAQPNRGRRGGPRTAKGRQVVSRNAVKHAANSLNPVAGGESEDEWSAFHEGVREALRPVGTVEEEIVRDLALTMWRRRRVIRAEKAAISQQREAIDDPHSYGPSLEALTSVDEIWASTGCDLEICMGLLQSLESLDGQSELVDPQWPGALDLLAFYDSGQCAPLPDSRSLPRPWTAQQLREHISEVTTGWGTTYDGLVRAVLVRIRDQRLEVEQRNLARQRRRSVLEAEALLPSPEQQDRLIRAEAHLDRRFAKGLDQLELLQRMRSDGGVPPPLRIQVSDE